jgi:hypothetical protein
MPYIENKTTQNEPKQSRQKASSKTWLTPQLTTIDLINQTKGGTNTNAESNVGSPGAFS